MLLAWEGGEAAAFDQLVPLVHEELHRLARRYMRQERSGHTLQATALVNEAYIRLIEAKDLGWTNRAHVVAIAPCMMRRILVDFARARGDTKRGGGVQKVPLDEAVLVLPQAGDDLVALDEALQRLEAVHPRRARSWN